MNRALTNHVWIPEPKVAFHPDRAGDVDAHPLRGMLRYGPYSSGLIPDPVRIATLAPAGESEPLYDFIRQLRESWKPGERTDYLPDWPGFSNVFGVHIRAASAPCHQTVPSTLDDQLAASATPHRDLADALLRAIHLLHGHRPDFDVLFIYLPERWSHAFVGGPEDDFDLHDFLKASTAARGLPIQVVREGKALAYKDRASVMWRIGVALYAKAGGVPWKLSGGELGTAHIGLSYAVRPRTSERPRFVTCCSQVFDADGAGLEFVAYDAHEVEVQRENPFLSRTEMFRVMTRSVDLYRRRHAGRSPRRVIVHKNSEFKREEVDGCMEALHLADQVDLVHIIKDVGWRGARIRQPRGSGSKGEAHAFPVERGTLLDVGPRDALLWTHGDVAGISDKGSFFRGQRSTPKPLRLVRYAGHGSWDDVARAILGLTKMNWNNDALYDVLPVTMSYARILAGVVKRMPTLGPSPYQFRYFM